MSTSQPAPHVPSGYSERIDRALSLAAIVHQRQQRKGTVIPYLIHPVQVGWIVMRHGYEEELVLAGLLHDVLEDACWKDRALAEALRTTFGADAFPAETPLRESVERLIATRFGTRVLELVDALSERKTDTAGQKRSWHERKAEQLAKLSQASRETMALKAADLIHNLHSTLRDVQTVGLETFQRFNAGAVEQLRHYAAVVQLVAERLGACPIRAELRATLGTLSQEIAQKAVGSDATLQAAAEAVAKTLAKEE